MTELGAFHTPSSWKELNDWIDLTHVRIVST